MDKKQQVMELWRRCFDDADEFVRFYFDRKYTDTDSLVYEENGRALAALQMIPYPMSWEKGLVMTAYISGACTLPEVRNRGFMTLLLQSAFQEMYDRNIGFSVLIPAEEWLFGYYARQGYTAVFDYTIHNYTLTPAIPENTLPVVTSKAFDQNFAQHLFPYFEQHMGKRNCCIQHPFEDYLAVVEEAYLCEGQLWAIQQGEKVRGWALAVPDMETVCVKELFFDTPADKDNLLQNIHVHWPDKTVIYKNLPEGSDSRNFGMARLIHAHRMLQQFAAQHPDLHLVIKLSDPQLQANDGIYHITAGQCLRPDKFPDRIDCETDIRILTQALLGYHPAELPTPLNLLFSEARPYMSLMLE